MERLSSNPTELTRAQRILKKIPVLKRFVEIGVETKERTINASCTTHGEKIYYSKDFTLVRNPKDVSDNYYRFTCDVNPDETHEVLNKATERISNLLSGKGRINTVYVDSALPEDHPLLVGVDGEDREPLANNYIDLARLTIDEFNVTVQSELFVE